MTEYVKILSGATSARMSNSERLKYVRLAWAESSPGDGWWPVEKVRPKPIPAEGEELAYTYTVDAGVARKEYFLVPRGSRVGPRRWTRFAIKGALADAHLLPAAKEFLATFEIKPGYTALEAITDVNFVEEGYGGDELWNALLNGAAQALGKTRAEVDAFMDALPEEVET